MPNAIAGALNAINGVAAEGDLAAAAAEDVAFDLDAGEPVVLPDGKKIYVPRLFGRPIDELACELMDMENPGASKFLRLIGPPGGGKSQIARAIAYRMWTGRGRAVTERDGEPFYGFVEMSPGAGDDKHFFLYDYVPVVGGNGESKLVHSLFVEAMIAGWVVMLDEPNAAEDTTLMAINGTLDSRLTLYLPATATTVKAAPGFAVILAYNPHLVGGSDIPVSWRRRFPAVLEVTSNWAALAKLGVPAALVNAARRLDARRFAGDDGLTWTPQFADIQDLAEMMARLGERAGVAFFISNLAERLDAGEVQAVEAEAVTRMLDEAGYQALKVPATSGRANLHGYLRAVTG